MYNHKDHEYTPGGKTITLHKRKVFQVFNYLSPAREPRFRSDEGNDECVEIIGKIIESVSDPAYGFDPGMEINAAINIGNMGDVGPGEKILFCDDVLKRCYAVGALDSEVDFARCGCIVISCTIRREVEEGK